MKMNKEMQTGKRNLASAIVVLWIGTGMWSRLLGLHYEILAGAPCFHPQFDGRQQETNLKSADQLFACLIYNNWM